MDHQEDLQLFLAAGPMVDSDHPAVADFARRTVGETIGSRAQAVALYYAVRDSVRYDPYTSSVDPVAQRASTVLAAGRGYCVSKATLLAAVCRAAGIPARLGYADVRNHMSTAKMRERMQTDVFYWHGYTSIYIDGAWVKATPAFNVELCEKFGLLPLEFDGREDSLYHPFDVAGNRHMEYLRHRGEYAEPPLAEIHATFIAHYPHWRNRELASNGDFDAEVDAEVGSRD